MKPKTTIHHESHCTYYERNENGELVEVVKYNMCDEWTMRGMACVLPPGHSGAHKMEQMTTELVKKIANKHIN